MRNRKWSRRDVLRASAVSAAGVLFAEPLRAAVPPPAPVTPALIEAARKEGKVAFYTALELNTAERLSKTFEARYPGIAVRVERSGAERIFAAKLFQSFFFSAEAQQLLVDTFAHRSFHAQVKEKPGHTPLSALKLLKADPAAVQAQSEEIKARYSKLLEV